MNQVIFAQLQRIDTALNKLIESLSAFNPSLSAAVDLLAADDALSSSLDLLGSHQKNHARILRLRQRSEDLDNQIRADVTLLADTRKQLLAAPATPYSPSNHDVTYQDLLSYAKRISKFTVPPTFRQPAAKEDFQDLKRRAGSPQAGEEMRDLNSSPPGEHAQREQGLSKEGGIGVASLPPEHKQWLDATTGIHFVPWPSDDAIRRGALAQIQSMVEQGVDPATATIEAQQQAEERVKADEEERANKALEEEERQRKGSLGGGSRSTARETTGPSMFGGLDLFDPEAEDD